MMQTRDTSLIPGTIDNWRFDYTLCILHSSTVREIVPILIVKLFCLVVTNTKMVSLRSP